MYAVTQFQARREKPCEITRLLLFHKIQENRQSFVSARNEHKRAKQFSLTGYCSLEVIGDVCVYINIVLENLRHMNIN